MTIGATAATPTTINAGAGGLQFLQPVLMSNALTINGNTTPPAALNGSLLFVTGTDTGSGNVRVTIDAYNTTAPQFCGRRNRGTNAAPAPLLLNDTLISFNAFGHDGSAYSGGVGSFGVSAAENWTTASHATYTQFGTTPTGAMTQSQRVRLDQDGALIIDPAGNFPNDGVSQLQVLGKGKFSLGLGVFNATPPAAKPSVTGSRGGNAALASLITALASYGLVLDSTTA
jgi:hypothetical protein